MGPGKSFRVAGAAILALGCAETKALDAGTGFDAGMGGATTTCDSSAGCGSPDACGPGGCLTCVPGTETCTDGVASTCTTSATRVEYACDSVQGMVCEPDGCKGPCSPTELGSAYLGCEYYPVVTPNGVWRDRFSFAVAIGNTSSVPANVVVDRNGSEIATRTVAPESVEVIELPWVDELKGPDSTQQFNVVPLKESAKVVGGAYRLRSDRPIAVYQFNPLEYSTHEPGCDSPTAPNECFSFTNDASLLLPANALTGNYVVTGPRSFVHPGFQQGDFVSITAVRAGTSVKVRPSANVYPGGGGVSAISKGTVATFDLEAGDTLQLCSIATGVDDNLSGTVIETADGKPVQVLSGILATFVPNELEAADHLEDVVLPVQALGKKVVVSAPTNGTSRLAYSLRIQGVFANTQVSFQPASVHAGVTLGEGEVLHIQGIDKDVIVSATNAFGVTQYLHGQEDVLVGDPSQASLIPIEQYRKDYAFIAPSTYDESFVNVVASADPALVTIVLDEKPLDPESFEPLGAVWVARFRLCGVPGPNCADQPYHQASSSEPFGLTVYGYGKWTSYFYSGGLDLEPITIPPPIIR